VASKTTDVLLYPLKCSNLVHKGIAAFSVFRMLLTQSWKCKMTQSSQSIVDGDQDNLLPGKFFSYGAGAATTTSNKGTPVDPNHDGQFCIRVRISRRP